MLNDILLLLLYIFIVQAKTKAQGFYFVCFDYFIYIQMSDIINTIIVKSLLLLYILLFGYNLFMIIHL